MNFLPLLARRSLRYWQLLLTLILGVLLSTALLASGPLLVQFVQNAALPVALRSQNVLDGSLKLSVFQRPDPQAFAEMDAGMRATISDTLKSAGYQVLSASSMQFMYPWLGAQLLLDQRVNLSTYQAAPDTVAMIAGEWPGPPAADGRIPVAIGTSFADTYGLQVGDELPLSLRTSAEQPDIVLLISGILQPKTSGDPRWAGELNPLRDQADERYTVQFSVLLPQESYFQVAQQLFPTSELENSWYVLVDPPSLTVSEIPAFRQELQDLQNQLPNLGTRVLLDSNLPGVLDKVEQEANGIAVPLYILLLEVLLLALYYVVMVSGLYVRQVEGEFARLGSRGASTGQVLRMQTIEAGLLALLGLLLGPLLAFLLIEGLAAWGPFTNVVQLTHIRITIPAASWVAAALGAVVLLLALLLPAIPAVRRGVITYLQNRAREERPPLWQRLYLDVFLLAAGLVFLWRLQLSGGFNRVDWLLLLAPLALLLGTATILLRLIPPLLRGLAELTARGRGLALPLALRQAARSPNHIARLVLLLTLTMALGILATGLGATLDTSEQERARYAAGADLRLVFDGFTAPGDVSAQPGVSAVAATWRSPASINVRAYRSFPTFELLAIEPYSLADVTSFRSDFSAQPMGVLLGYLATDPAQVAPVLPLPGHPQQVGLWLGVPNQKSYGYNPLEYINLQAKLKTAQGQMIMTNLDLSHTEPDPNAENAVWGLFTGDLPKLDPGQYPLSLHSFWFRVRNVPERVSQQSFFSYNLAVDDLSTAEAGGDFQVVEDFEEPTRIWQTNVREMSARFSRRGIHRSGSASVLIILPNSSGPVYAFSLADTNFNRSALPALVSQGFLDATGLEVGQSAIVQLLGTTETIDIRGVVDYFPTMYDQGDQSFIITASTPLLNRLNGILARPINPTDLWIRASTAQAIPEIKTAFPGASNILDIPSEIARVKADPLALGLRGVTTLGTLVTFILSLVGFITYFILSARQRMTTYGVLRSLGISPGQLYGSLLVEQSVLILAGMALGIGMGVLLNRLILPDLPVVLGGGPPVPPFIPQDNWPAVLRLILGLGVAYLLALAVGTLLLMRTRMHRVLRIGEE
jgi:hypothetical protein